MGDPASLMAMIESHLSKTSLTTSQNADNQAGPSNVSNVQNSSSKPDLPPPTVMQLPRFEVNARDINELLTHQFKNMIMSRENAMNEEIEKQRLANQLSRMNIKDENNDKYAIDLSASIMKPGPSQLQSEQQVKCLPLSKSSSVESLDQNIAKNQLKPKQESLPICDNMSYILFQRVKKGRCSSFGKVLSTRLRPVAAPYLHTKIHNPDVVPFDFSTPSPCDINKAKKLAMTMSHDSNTRNNTMERIVALTKDEDKA